MRIQITTPYYCASAVFTPDGKIVSVDPILSWMKQQGWSFKRACSWASNMGYELEIINER